MSQFLNITYAHISIGRVELWMEGTGEFDENGHEIFKAVREPTSEDLAYAERTEAGKVRYIHAIARIQLPPDVIQLGLRSEQYDEDVAGSALQAALNVTDCVNREVTIKLKELVGNGLLASLPSGTLFNYQQLHQSCPVEEWKEIAK